MSPSTSFVEPIDRLQSEGHSCPGHLPLTRDGQVKRRLTIREKLVILDPNSDPDATQERLMAFMNVFAFRTTGGIITRAGGGPSSWAALRAPIEEEQVARHLLADRLLPIFRPQWVGSRSPSTTRVITLDVDADRPDNPILSVDGLKHIYAYGYRDLERFSSDRAAAQKRARAKVPFADRCRSVEEFFRRLGANPDDPNQILKQATPSGGRHYYAFLDKPYFLSQVNGLFLAAGLRHLPGQIEFFPSLNRALRLPFGHVPGQVHDPQAWIKFIDDLVNHRFRRFSLEEMYHDLSINPGRQARGGGQSALRTSDVAGAKGAGPCSLGLPRGRQDESQPSGVTEPDIEVYLRLVNDGCSSIGEAKYLLDVGVLVEGTRTSALKQLAAHLIWIVGYSADQAAEALTTWAMNDRHQSKDIRADLAAGTSKVEKQIVAMCRWYAKERRTDVPTDRGMGNRSSCFAPEELDALTPAIQSLPEEDRADQASFYLSFLTFGKRHGRPKRDGSSWEAAPAINAVVRKWDGCRGRSRYLTRMNAAKAAGLLVMVREKLQVPGGKGRARTYSLSVPVVDQSRWTIPRAEALARLTGSVPRDQDPEHQPPIPHDNLEGDNNEQPAIPIQHPGPHPDPGPVRQGGSGGGLGSRPPCGPGEPAPVETLPHRGHETGSALPASGTPEPAVNNDRETTPVGSAPSAVQQIRNSAGPAVADDPFIARALGGCELSPRMKAILTKPMRWMTTKDQVLMRHLLYTRGQELGEASDPESVSLRQRITHYARRFCGAGITNWTPRPS